MMGFLELLGATALWAIASLVAAAIVAAVTAKMTEGDGLAGLVAMNIAIIGTLVAGAGSWLIWIISMVVS